MKKFITILLIFFSFSSQAQDTLKTKNDTIYKLYRGEYARVISSEVIIKDTSHKAIIEAKRTRRGKILWRVFIVGWTILTTFGVIYSSN